jgi:hypothetical protein
VTVTSDLGQALGEFSSVVVTGTDPDGYPASFRCRPEKDPAGVLRLDVPAWAGLAPGPASVMAHSHNEQLWDLRGFVAKGTLEASGEGLVFRPLTFTRTAGGPPLDTLRFIRACRRTAARYLARRGLARPAVPWDTIKAAKKTLPR